MSAPEIEIQQEIERTRDHLGETVEELAARADVRTRARAKAAEVRGKAAEAAGQLRQSRLVQGGMAQGRLSQRRWPAAAAAAAVVIGSILIRRRRRKA